MVESLEMRYIYAVQIMDDFQDQEFHMDASRHTINIKPARIATILVILSLILVVLSLTGQWFRLFPDSYSISGPTQEFFLDLFIDKFSVNTENNVPTYFNTVILVIAAFLTFAIASAKYAQKDKYRYEWFLLGFVFLYLSVDEAAVIHEQFGALFKDAPSMGGWLHYKWVIPGMAALLILGLVFLRFFLHLDRRFKIFFLISAAVYLSGALGGELFSGHYADAFGTKNFTYAVMTTVEESLEWLGITSMVFTLLKYIETHVSEVGFQIKTGTEKK
jgi:hypothetical protein